MTLTDIAKRLSAVERELAGLKAGGAKAGKSLPVRALERIHSTFENDDAFQEAVRLGRRWRNSERSTTRGPKAKRK